MVSVNKMELNKHIEHTFLKPDTTKDQILQLCAEAIEYDFFGVCVPPYYVKTAKEVLKKHPVKVITVTGFPLGYCSISAKVEETRKAIEDGADEIDMVMNIAAMKSGDFQQVKDGIESVCTLSHLKNKVMKVIIETCLLTEEEIIKACEICAEVGVDFVKTSTGFNGEGAKTEHIKLMKMNLPEKIKIKASGGIKTFEQALKMIEAGAERIGTSSGVQIMSEQNNG